MFLKHKEAAPKWDGLEKEKCNEKKYNKPSLRNL